jgi:hypothetical protein
MADHSARPSLDHLRRQARDLLRAARAGDTTAADRIQAVADALTLASAQLAVARQAEAFCEASIRDGTRGHSVFLEIAFQAVKPHPPDRGIRSAGARSAAWSRAATEGRRESSLRFRLSWNGAVL